LAQGQAARQLAVQQLAARGQPSVRWADALEPDGEYGSSQVQQFYQDA